MVGLRDISPSAGANGVHPDRFEDSHHPSLHTQRSLTFVTLPL